MCRYCPPTAIVCIEPADEAPELCAFCTEAPAADALLVTAAMASHAAVREGDRLCPGCHADITEDLARVPCALCERREDPDRVDRVDTFAGAAAIVVCHVCILGHREAMDAICDAACEAAVDAMEAGLDLAGPLPTDPDWLPLDEAPANDALDAGDAA